MEVITSSFFQLPAVEFEFYQCVCVLLCAVITCFKYIWKGPFHHTYVRTSHHSVGRCPPPGPRTPDPGEPGWFSSQKTSQFSVFLFSVLPGKIVKGTGTISTLLYDTRTGTYVCTVCTGISVHTLHFYFKNQVTIPIQSIVRINIKRSCTIFNIAVRMILVNLIESWTDNQECGQWTVDQFDWACVRCTHP